ncbi:RNA dependent RNA polymerase-domain-containing protein [Mycena filopes]|nr:RNA dependent RNA polymerase-domain-containing protein [Mycena filopes]
MHQKQTLAKQRVPFLRLLLDLSAKDERLISDHEYDVNESRATRLVGDSRRFMSVAFTRNSKDQHLATWLEGISQPGKCIAYEGGHYVFLGYTENNLKSGQILFFREGEDFTVDQLKDRFGSDLRAVYEAFGYGKYAARLGLSFSSTVATEEIKLEERHLLPDLTADDGSLTSDGCGLIRDSYAAETSASLGLPLDTAVFQIRLGGIKGTLTRCPDDLFDRLCGDGKKIAYRRSMIKYNEGPHILEIQSVSKAPKTGRLNKQFIVLLLTRGIPLSVFEELLQMQLDEIDKITTDRGKALDCVEGDVDAEADGFYQELYEMLLAGHDMNEPYLANQLRRFQNASRDSLRKKLNITLKGSGYLLGVVDHCNVLQEGEVYINLPTKGGPQVGPVATMRNPAYDPSGIRVLEAVNRPELKHLTNCIVFSACGSHSETDRMGGGDLDGDLFFTIFNPALIPESRSIPAVVLKKPATRSRTIAIGGRVQTTSRSSPRSKDMRVDAIETFVRFRCNFLLGALSNEWMALVGTTPQLADHPLCMALVPMIEETLDIVKSGGSLAILRHQFDRLKNRNCNMQRPEGWTNPLEYLATLIPQASPATVTDFTPDPQLILRKDTTEEKWDALVQEAEIIMPAYNRSLQLAIEADKEAKLQGFQDDEKRADAMKADMIAKHFPPVQNILKDTSKHLLKASVWYWTGYSRGKQSFAWLGARWLNHIKASQCGHVPISVGARSTSLMGTPRQPPSTPPRATNTTSRPRLPPTPMSMTRPLPVPPSIPVPLAMIAVDSDFEVDDNNTDIESDEFEVIDKESAYDTALEDLVPLTSRLHIDTASLPRRVVRENSDDTLVDVDPEPERSRHRTRTHAPPSPVSPFSDVTARPATRGQGTRRVVASPVDDANVTTTRPRTRAQTRIDPPRVRSPEPEPPRTRTRTRTRAVSPTPVSTISVRAGHTRATHKHAFLIQPNTPGRTRVCVCGVFCTMD